MVSAAMSAHLRPSDQPNTRASSKTIRKATTKALTEPASASISRYDTPAATRSLGGNCRGSSITMYVITGIRISAIW